MLLAALKWIVPRSLLGRSILIIVAPVVLLQVVVAGVFWETHWDRITGRLVDNFVGDVVVLLNLMQIYPGQENRQVILPLGWQTGMHVWYQADGRLPHQPPRAENTKLERDLTTALTQRLNRPFHLDLASGPDRDGVALSVQLPEGVLHVVAPRKRVDSSSTYVFTLWVIGSSMLLFGIAMLFMRNQVRSVRRLAAAADSFGKGRDVPDFKPEGATEVRQAAIAFNRMRDRLQRQIAQRTEMLAGVSHDLRTPLTRMKLQLAMMGNGDGIAELSEDVAEMERMIEGYLAFARGEGAEQVQETDLAALIEDVAGRFRREGAEIALHLEPDLRLPLRPHAFDRCLSNLLANARRHAQRMELSTLRRGNAVEVLVDDDGPGIPVDQREAVFKAFVRLETSRNRRTGGVGLGLAIARDVVRSQGGEILLEDAPLGGLRVRVRLPV
jgi:two-component system osmolarity sensor histidine kinase EnvZ